jgi:hypothetical protein
VLMLKLVSSVVELGIFIWVGAGYKQNLSIRIHLLGISMENCGLFGN